MDKPHVAALKEAIRIAGSQTALASGIGSFLDRPTSQQLISYWLRTETKIDPEYWPAIEHVTRKKVTRAKLRPDVFKADRAA